MRFLGVDLAWGEGNASKPANRNGVVVLDQHGQVLDAGWTCGLDETVACLNDWGDGPCLAFIDAPLVVTNETGPRDCDRTVGKRFGHYWVSANTVNLASPRQARVHLRERLADHGWRYDDGIDGPPTSGRTLSECYPYTTLVGAAEFAFRPYRPAYKRKPKKQPMSAFWPVRLEAWDAIVARLDALADADPPLWWRHGPKGCVPLGAPGVPAVDRQLTATIIAPTTAEATSGPRQAPAPTKTGT